MYKEPVGGGAGLADVSELGRQRSLNGSVDVGTLQDNEGSVATEFHRAPQNPLGGLREEQPADRRRASEAQLSQPRVGKQRLADGGRARACHQVDHPGWQAGLLQYIDQEHCGEWGEVGRLEDDRASGGQGGRDLAGRHGELGSPRPLPRSPLSNQWKLKLSEISIQANASTPNATASGTACLSLSTIG